MPHAFPHKTRSARRLQPPGDRSVARHLGAGERTCQPPNLWFALRHLQLHECCRVQQRSHAQPPAVQGRAGRQQRLSRRPRVCRDASPCVGSPPQRNPSTAHHRRAARPYREPGQHTCRGWGCGWRSGARTARAPAAAASPCPAAAHAAAAARRAPLATAGWRRRRGCALHTCPVPAAAAWPGAGTSFAAGWAPRQGRLTRHAAGSPPAPSARRRWMHRPHQTPAPPPPRWPPAPPLPRTRGPGCRCGRCQD